MIIIFGKKIWKNLINNVGQWLLAFTLPLLLLYRYLSISIDVSILLYGYFYFTLLYLSNNMIMYACLSVYGKDSDQF